MHERQLSFHSAPQKHPCDEKAINFVCPFEDAIDPGIPIVAFHRIFLAVTIAAIDLNSFIHHEVQHFGAPHLDNRAFDGIFLDSLQSLCWILRLHFLESTVDHTHRAV